jgi:hypothetical protein
MTSARGTEPEALDAAVQGRVGGELGDDLLGSLGHVG